jgi:hypothetical protein
LNHQHLLIFVSIPLLLNDCPFIEKFCICHCFRKTSNPITQSAVSLNFELFLNDSLFNYSSLHEQFDQKTFRFNYFNLKTFRNNSLILTDYSFRSHFSGYANPYKNYIWIFKSVSMLSYFIDFFWFFIKSHFFMVEIDNTSFHLNYQLCC